METPNSTKPNRVVAMGPLLLEIAEGLWKRRAIPIVDDIQQVSTRFACDQGFLDSISRPAIGGYALLKGDI